MLKIAICEDNRLHCRELHKAIGRILFDREDIEVTYYESGDILLKETVGKANFLADLIFMDIEMPGMDGMETARILREKRVRSAIVFVTCHEEFVFQGYEVHAYDYLLKPVSEERLRGCLIRFLDERKLDSEDYLVVNKRLGGVRILLSQVRYFVSSGRKIMAVMEKPYESVEFYMQMNQLEGILAGGSFFRCHQSFLINRDKVLCWDSGGIMLTGGEEIPVSRRYKTMVNAMAFS